MKKGFVRTIVTFTVIIIVTLVILAFVIPE